MSVNYDHGDVLLTIFSHYGAMPWYAKLEIGLVKGANVLVTAANKLWKDKCVDSKGFPSQLDVEVALGQRNNPGPQLGMTSTLIIIFINALYFLLTSLNLIQIERLQSSLEFGGSNDFFPGIFFFLRIKYNQGALASKALGWWIHCKDQQKGSSGLFNVCWESLERLEECS